MAIYIHHSIVNQLIRFGSHFLIHVDDPPMKKTYCIHILHATHICIESGGAASSAILLKHVVLVHGDRNIPCALHAFGELHKVPCSDLYILITMTIGIHLDLAFQKVALLLCRVRPWKLAWGTSPPTQNQNNAIKATYFIFVS